MGPQEKAGFPDKKAKGPSFSAVPHAVKKRPGIQGTTLSLHVQKLSAGCCRRRRQSEWCIPQFRGHVPAASAFSGASVRAWSACARRAALPRCHACISARGVQVPGHTKGTAVSGGPKHPMDKPASHAFACLGQRPGGRAAYAFLSCAWVREFWIDFRRREGETFPSYRVLRSPRLRIPPGR